MKKIVQLIFMAILFTACEEDFSDDTNPDAPVTEPTENLMINGLTYGNSDKSLEDANTIITDALNEVEPIKIVAEIVHSNNAAMVDEILNPTKVILFGNPNLGTPLMQKNQLTGLDLPQKLLLFQDDDEQLKIAYNNVTYLAQRHDVGNVETLNTISGALANFAMMVANEDLITADAESVELGEGITIKSSENSFEDTYDKLIEAINANEQLRIIRELDHSANAASVNLELLPTKLVIFGNPNLGTPLMQNAQTIGIDLPQKMLVYENEMGEVHVAYNDPDFLAKRHGITGNEAILMTIGGALDNLSMAAVSP